MFSVSNKFKKVGQQKYGRTFKWHRFFHDFQRPIVKYPKRKLQKCDDFLSSKNELKIILKNAIN